MRIIEEALTLLNNKKFESLKEHLEKETTNNIYEEPFLLDWINCGPFFKQLRELYCKDKEKKKIY